MQTIQSGGDGVKKFCALIVAAAVMLCLYYTVRTYGNIFYMSYALNSAKKICNREYGSSLSVSNYRYERENDRYLITVTDVNGLSADVVYDSVNGIRDGYADVYKSVRANTVRGEFQRILNSLGIDAVCNVKMIYEKVETVGGDGGRCGTLYIDFGVCGNKNDFSAKIVSAFPALREADFDLLYASCVSHGKNYVFYSPKSDLSKNANDISQRINSLTNYG